MIIEKARELGIALSESKEFNRMVAAREAMDEDIVVTRLVEEYQEKQQEIVDILSGDDPDRDKVVALTSDVDNIQATLLANPVFSEMLEAQNEFQQLMNQVNSVIGSCIGIEPEEEHSCSGSCASCSGCCH